MEVVAATPGGGAVPPFHNHDVREWSRIDSLTGVLERARLETDHWTASNGSSSHKYGKVVDSRARSGADGSVQAKRQLEVFQSQVPGGRLQVVKTHTVSSTRWTGNASTRDAEDISKDFEDLQLSLNPLDLTSQKSKASIGKSVARRPPSRPRFRDETSSNGTHNFREPPLSNHHPFRNVHETAAENLHRVSRLCHRVHEEAVRRTFGEYFPINERQSGDGVEIHEIESEESKSLTKSTSSEDLAQKDSSSKSIEDLEDLEQLQNWRRTSKIRRSLQFPKQSTKGSSRPSDLPENSGSVRRIREDLETGRRLSTALRGNNVDLEALDQILQSISGSSTTSDDRSEEPEKERKQKRNSFVTVESLQEVKGRLRRTSSPTADIYRSEKEGEIDDGIVTEENMPSSENTKSRVRSYVYGMEAMLNKKPIVGTGSLESKSKQSNGNSTNRNDDWYNRRKSYGFEQVSNQQESTISSSRSKTKVESSTDSGICRSTETLKKNGESESDIKNSDSVHGNVKKFSSLFEQKDSTHFINNKAREELNHVWNRRSSLETWKTPKEATTITIPIVSENSPIFQRDNDHEIKRHSIAVDESKYVTKNAENKFRRTSLAVNDNSEFNDCLEEDVSSQRKPKKVEFCKTEIHFTAESGKVNIVETDEKPPPTNNFRRRRRNIGPIPPISDDYNKNGLPVLHFGDSSYEKTLLGMKNPENGESGDEGSLSYESNTPLVSCSKVTVNTSQHFVNELEEGKKEQPDSDAPKGILKNKPIKPRPYHLGEEDLLQPTQDQDSSTWGVKLKPVQKDDAPIWRSTVTVRNTFYDQNHHSSDNKDHKIATPKQDRGNFEGIRIVSPSLDARRSSWSVADRVKHVEDLQWTENKGYSTKVNFGNGEATVVENGLVEENGRHPTWPRNDESTKDGRKNVLNKGLVVRIGRDDTNSKHTVCSKTTTNRDSSSTTTTTKITIDLSPSPTRNVSRKEPPLSLTTPLHNFKSTSLILNTIKTENEAKLKQDLNSAIPQQLEALRKLYDDVASDNEADREVQCLLSKISERNVEDYDDGSSVISGSWSRVTAFRNVNRFSKFSKTQNGLVVKPYAQIEKGFKNAQTTTTETRKEVESHEESPTHKKTNIQRNKYSPIISRKKQNHIYSNDELSSPSLVGQNITKTEHIYETINKKDEVEERSMRSHSPVKSYAKQSSPRHRSPVGKEVIFRQPKKSEMAYFGVPVSPRCSRKEAVKKAVPKIVEKENKPVKEQPKRRTDSPIYANIDEIKSDSPVKREFDASILEELTKAADQILQAVNGYTDDEDTKSKSWRNEPLDTISETKSWKQQKVVQTKTSAARTANSKSKLKHTSSTSSVESVSRECRRNSNPRRSSTGREEKVKKKVMNEGNTTSKALTKARRLQRASSREALLQSHGSSSEDLPANVVAPPRKPRLIKKTKTAQLTITNGLEMRKSSTLNCRRYEDSKSKPEERVPVAGLPEIRHKTAVSTIRSTAEKVANRQNGSRTRTEELKKRSLLKKETNRGSPQRSEKSRATPLKESGGLRIATANIRRCSKAESVTRH